jgi:small subunit ribosomal protein S11
MAERKTSTKTKGRKRERKSVPRGRAYVQSTFNNTLITLTDPNVNVLSWASAGQSGFKGSR